VVDWYGAGVGATAGADELLKQVVVVMVETGLEEAVELVGETAHDEDEDDDDDDDDEEVAVLLELAHAEEAL
jgi:hypothetical protein